MPDYLTLSFLPMLKGAPLSCLIAMQIYPRPINLQFLCEATGYDLEAITQALVKLSDLGYIQHQPPDRWILAPHGRPGAFLFQRPMIHPQ